MAIPSPEFDAVVAYLGTDAQQWSDDGFAVLDKAVDAEIAAQEKAIDVDSPRTPDQLEALCRRVARNLALRQVPMGVQFGGEAGSPVRISGQDPEVRRLEAPYRKWTVR